MTDNEHEDRALEALIVSKLLADCDQVDDQKLPSLPEEVRKSLPSSQRRFLDSIIERAQSGVDASSEEIECENRELSYGMNRADDDESDDELTKNRGELVDEFEEEEDGDGDSDRS